MDKQKQSLSLPERQRGAYAAPALAEGDVSALDRWWARRLLQLCGAPPVTVVLWNGEVLAGTQGPKRARLHITDRGALYRLLTHPTLQFGDLYSTGRLDVEGDLQEFLQIVYRALARLGGPASRLLRRTMHRPRRNSLAGSRENIQHHYDIGNSFYALWLDRDLMQYTCAYFHDPNLDLEAAQVAKLHHVCRKLRLRPGETVVEAGCGWGGLARFMARHYGVKVRAYNISREQVAHAREQARREGLDGQVEYVEDDYRNIDGRYDAFVSVGMLEHVGVGQYETLGEVLDRCLAPHGRGLIHTIGRNCPGQMNPWIERRIFPGAQPPALSEMTRILEPRAFSVQDVENLRLHYARTLEHWLVRFEQQTDKVREMFDETFVRAWRLYLNGSIAAFQTGALQLFQVVFTRPEHNELPWSRAHLYGDH